MLSTTMVSRCCRRGSEGLRKHGLASDGAERARCLECERTFILEPEGAALYSFFWRAYCDGGGQGQTVWEQGLTHRNRGGE